MVVPAVSWTCNWRESHEGFSFFLSFFDFCWFFTVPIIVSRLRLLVICAAERRP
jgi:hypothetical protein